MIREHMLVAQSRQRCYADVRKKGMEFQVVDWVLLKVSPTIGVVRFGTTGKLTLSYIGPFLILARIGRLINDWSYWTR